MMTRRIALVIGINKYQHYNHLEYCASSARAVYDLLVDEKYGGCNQELSKLFAEADKDLTTINMFQLVRDTVKSLNVADQLIFYFTGHGLLNTDDTLALITSDAKDAASGYQFSHLVTDLRNHNLSKGILIIDSCHSAAMRKSIGNLMSNSWKPSKIPNGFVFMASTDQYEGDEGLYAHLDDNLGLTIFSHFFCQGITTGANSKNEYVTLLELQEYINENIEIKYPASRQKAQIPASVLNSDLRISRNPKYIVSANAEKKAQVNTNLLEPVDLRDIVRRNPKWIHPYVISAETVKKSNAMLREIISKYRDATDLSKVNRGPLLSFLDLISRPPNKRELRQRKRRLSQMAYDNAVKRWRTFVNSLGLTGGSSFGDLYEIFFDNPRIFALLPSQLTKMECFETVDYVYTDATVYKTFYYVVFLCSPYIPPCSENGWISEIESNIAYVSKMAMHISDDEVLRVHMIAGQDTDYENPSCDNTNYLSVSDLEKSTTLASSESLKSVLSNRKVRISIVSYKCLFEAINSNSKLLPTPRSDSSGYGKF